jgi:hypothetical protein
VTRRLRDHPAAARELLAAIEWYHRERAGLGGQLLAAIDEAIGTIVTWPMSAPALPGWDRDPGVRVKNVRAFPYRIIFLPRDTEIFIVAYAHARRRPNYWADRLDA